MTSLRGPGERNFNAVSHKPKLTGTDRPIANMATISPKRGFSVATVAKGWSLVYMLMRVRYLVVFFTLGTIKKLSRSQRRFNVLK